MSAAADRLSNDKARQAVKWMEEHGQHGDFLFAAANTIAEVPKASDYRYTFTRKTISYVELLRAFNTANGGQHGQNQVPA
jgi:hypothetical protein